MASKTENVKLGVCGVKFDGVDLGYTKGGVTVAVATETKKIMVDQFGNSEVNEYIMGRTCSVTVPLAETTLENLVKIMPGATLTETGGTEATGTITLSGQPAANDSITINGVKFTFVATTPGPLDILIGAAQADTVNAISAKLAASIDPAVSLASYTDNDTAIVSISYKTKADAGNDFSLGKQGTNIAISGAALSGGVDSKKRVDVTHGIGQSLLALAKQLVLHPIANDASNVSEDFTIPKAMTAGSLEYAFKLDEERVWNVTFTAYPDISTSKLFFVGDATA